MSGQFKYPKLGVNIFVKELFYVQLDELVEIHLVEAVFEGCIGLSPELWSVD